MKLLKLTREEATGLQSVKIKKCKCWIRPETINYIVENNDGKSNIFFTEGHRISVSETPEQIIAALDEIQ